MPKIKLNLKGLSIGEKVDKARQIVKALTGNPIFTTPQPPLATVTTAANDLDTAFGNAQTARQTAVTTTSIMNDKESALEAVLRKLAAYVESVAGDDESMILSAGMDVKGTGVSAPTTEAPLSLSATEGDHDGEIDLSWNSVKGARSYVIERSPDPPTASSWVHQSVSSKSSASVAALVSGTRYWFRVAAITSAGQTGFSDPATKIAP